ncbi:Surfeit locus protein 6 [Nymphon striatum]|nr:Surfeit locus protein 6 [Nymphon striatum]
MLIFQFPQLYASGKKVNAWGTESGRDGNAKDGMLFSGSVRNTHWEFEICLLGAFGELKQSLSKENDFIKVLIDTIPAQHYFDEDIKLQLIETKHETTNSKLSQKGVKRGKDIHSTIKNKYAKLDPDQNLTVTKLISTVHNSNKKIKSQQVKFNKEQDPVVGLVTKSTLKFGFLKKLTKFDNEIALVHRINQSNSILSTIGKTKELSKDIRDTIVDPSQMYPKIKEGVAENKSHPIKPDSELTEDQLAKRMRRKTNRQKIREKKKGEAKKNKKIKKNNIHIKIKPEIKVKQNDNNIPNQKPIYNKEGKMVFSKFDFGHNATKKPNMAGKDFKGLLNKFNKTQEKIRKVGDVDQKKAKKLEEKQAWHSAIEKASGVKVKNDPELLKNAIKMKEKRKKKSEKQWDNREKLTEKLKSTKQTKRNENIKKRITDKKQKKVKRAVKRGRIIPGFS